ncbi:MAG: cation:proton antiporter [Chloroflexi bacterium OHK40]
MSATPWYLIAGALFVLMALANSTLRRLPLSSALLYLLVGIGIGPAGLGLLRLNPLADAGLIERLSEVAVIVSLFTSGLKLRAALRDPIWRIPLRLAFGAMLVTVALIAAVGSLGLGLSLGAAVLLGAILAPTDPVLAADVQVERPSDQDRLRFGLTGEAGLNDGTAFPMVMLGLGLLGLHELGPFGWRWLAVDVVWATLAGLGCGWLLGQLIGRLVVYLRRTHREAVGLDDFLALGLIGLAYAVAHLLHAYGFLAVFAAGLALRHIELTESPDDDPEATELDAAPGDGAELATNPARAPAVMAREVLGFNEPLERIGEVAMVVVLGSLLVPLLPALPPTTLWFIPLLLIVIRPVAVLICLSGSATGPVQRGLTAWFGIRGIGSIYYLMYALTHGVEGDLALQLTAITVATVTVSIIVHGISVTPLMRTYRRLEEARA